MGSYFEVLKVQIPTIYVFMSFVISIKYLFILVVISYKEFVGLLVPSSVDKP